MPLHTSDIHKTIKYEIQMAKTMNLLSMCHSETKSSSFATPSENLTNNRKFNFSSIDAAVRSNTINLKNNVSNSALASCSNIQNTKSPSGNNTLNQSSSFHNSNNGDLASIDSSDTFMSCQTHPFLSQGDLTVCNDDDEIPCSNLDILDANALYSNIMNKNGSGGFCGQSVYNGSSTATNNSFVYRGTVKKSTSGDTALRNFSNVSTDDNCKGSMASLDDTPLPKHRKTRFQQTQQRQQETLNYKQKTRFDDLKNSTENLDVTVSNKKNRRASFMPTKIITTATKQLINQHIFGAHSKGKFYYQKAEFF